MESATYQAGIPEHLNQQRTHSRAVFRQWYGLPSVAVQYPLIACFGLAFASGDCQMTGNND